MATVAPVNRPETDGTFNYGAFISYRRSDGTPFANNLRRRLIGFKLPKQFRETPPRPKPRVYLDTVYERASPDFFENTIKKALRESRCLIIIQTPGAVESRSDGQLNWVEQEIAYFRTLPQRDRIFVALAIGSFDDPLPGDLHRERANMERVDIRKIGLLAAFAGDQAILPFVEEVYGIDNTRRTELSRETERLRAQRLTLYGLITLFIVFALAALAIAALIQRSEAIHQRNRAEEATRLSESRRQTAEAERMRAESEKSKAEAERRNAEQQRDRALSAERQSTARRLAASAQLLRAQPGRLMLSALLDVESTRRLPITENRSLLSSILDEMPGPHLNLAPTAGILRIASGPDGTWIATATQRSIDIWRPRTNRKKVSIDLGDAFSNSPIPGYLPTPIILSSPDGSWLTALPGDGKLNLWDTATGRRFRTINTGKGVGKDVFSIAKDGRTIAFATGKTVNVCETGESGRCWSFGVTDQISHLALLGNGDRMITCCSTTGAQIRETTSGKDLANITAETAHKMKLSPDGRFLVLSGLFKTLVVWDLAAMNPRLSFNEMSLGFQDDFFLSPDSRWLGVSHNNTRLTIIDLKSGKNRELQYPSTAIQQTFSNNGNWVVAVLADQTLRKWNVNTLREGGRFETYAGFSGFSLAPDASWVATVGLDGSADIWDINFLPHKFSIPLPAVGGFAPSSLISVDKKRILVNSGKQLQLWDADHEELRSTFDLGAPINQIALSPNSSDVAASTGAGGSNNEIKMFRSNKSKQAINTQKIGEWFSFAPGGLLLASYNLSLTLHYLNGGDAVILVPPERPPKKAKWVNAVFSRNGRWLFATGSRSDSSYPAYKLWEVRPLKELTVIPLASAKHASLSTSGDIVALSDTRSASIYNLKTQSRSSVLTTPAEVSGLFFDPTGRLLLLQFNERVPSVESMALLQAKNAAQEGGRKLWIWDWRQNSVVAKLAFEIGVTGTAFSSDGKWLAAALADQSIRIFSLTKSTEYIRLKSSEPIKNISFIQNDRVMAVEGVTRILFGPWTSEDLLDRVCSAIPRNLSVLEWSQYLQGERYRSTCVIKN